MKCFVCFFVLLSYLALSFSYAEQDDFKFSYVGQSEWEKEQNIPACSQAPMSQLGEQCINVAAKDKKTEYENQFKKFIAAVTKNKKYLDDADGYLKKVKSAKKNWDRYVEDECSSERIGYEDTESSGAQSDYSVCLIERYNQRIKYYKQQEEQYSF